MKPYFHLCPRRLFTAIGLLVFVMVNLTACSFGKPENIEEVVQQAVEEFEIPGIAAYIKADGQAPLIAAAGVSDLDSGQALKDTDQFRIYSVTKSFTALVTLQLIEEGILSLDDPVDKWLPESVVGSVPHHEQMTIRQLLSHSSGAYDYTSSEMERMPPFFEQLLASPETRSHWYTPQELIDFSTQFPPYFAPGEGATYSNTGYVIMGLIIEAATGNDIEDEMHARIIEPLGLTSTYFETPETPTNYVTGYHLMEDGELLNVSGSNSNTSYAWAAGGIISNIHDVGRYADALFSGELLQPESYTEMFTFIPDSNIEGKYWGLGVAQRDVPVGQVYAATGEAAGYEAKIIRIPDLNVTIIGLFNRTQADPAYDFIIENGLGLLEK